MKQVWFAFLALTCALALVACQPKEEGVEVHDYWIRTAAKGDNAAMYMLLHNHSLETDELLAASSDVAEAVELHQTTMDANGVMQMSPISSVVLDPGAEVYFKPGGLHVMLVALKQDLKAGDKIDVTLHFKNHVDMPLVVPVQEGADDMDGMDMP